MKKLPRNPNMFEKFLLIIGLFVIILGYSFIAAGVKANATNYWLFVQTILLWFLLVIIIILLAVNENMKEELRVIAKEQLEEIKLLRKEESKEINYEEKELSEIRSMKKNKAKNY